MSERPFDPVACQRGGHKARGLHLLDETCQAARAGLTSLGGRHEATGKQAQSRAGAFDDQTGRCLQHAHGVDRHKGDVHLRRLHRFDHLAGSTEGDLFYRHTEAAAEFTRQVNRQAMRLAARCALHGRQRVAEIDGAHAQPAVGASSATGATGCHRR